jgi:hypothetical protein
MKRKPHASGYNSATLSLRYINKETCSARKEDCWKAWQTYLVQKLLLGNPKWKPDGVQIWQNLLRDIAAKKNGFLQLKMMMMMKNGYKKYRLVLRRGPPLNMQDLEDKKGTWRHCIQYTKCLSCPVPVHFPLSRKSCAVCRRNVRLKCLLVLRLRDRFSIEKTNSVALVHQRTIPTERPPLVGEVVSTSADRCRMVRATDHHGRNRYYFFQAAPQLYSRGWVGPIPEPPLLRTCGSASNRTRTSGPVVRNSDHQTTEAINLHRHLL